jgi:hypothetical protein
MIKIDFSITKYGYTLKDAIVLPDDHNLSDAQIESIKQKRFDDWYAIITASQEEQAEE